MNRKKINSMILALGTIAAFTMGTKVEIKAVDAGNNRAVAEAALRETKAVDRKAEAVEKINAGKGEYQDYHTLLGITEVTNQNLNFVQEAVMKAKDKKGLDLTKSEIITYAKDAAKVSEFFEYIEEDAASLSEYAELNLTGVNGSNIEEFNRILKGKRILTSEDLQAFIDKVNTSIDKINAGEAELQDYKNIEIDVDINERNLDSINAAEKRKCKEVQSKLRIPEIKAAALEEIRYIEKCAVRINQGVGTLADYQKLNISGINEKNIAYANADLKGRNIVLAEEIQQIVDKDRPIYESINKINLGEASLNDYRNIGSNLVNEENLYFFNNQLKGYDYLTCSDVLKALDKNAVIHNSIDNISLGKASLEDYRKAGILGVTEENLSFINNEIVKEKDLSVENLQTEVNKIIRSYVYVEAVNKGSEVKNENGYVKEYYELAKISVTFDTKGDSELSLIRKAIEIQRKINNNKYLSKTEIINIIVRVDSNLEDAKLVLHKISEGITSEEAVLGRELNAREVKSVADSVIYETKYAVRRISLGLGTVDDYNFFGELRVNQNNVDAVNDDIKACKEIEKLSDYRLKGLKNQVTKALDVYNINIDNLSEDGDKNVKEYMSLGKTVAYDYKSTSVLRLTQDYILIKRKEKGGNLDRQAIISLLEEVEGNTDKYKILLPEITDKIFLKENESGRALTMQELSETITSVEEDIKNTVARLVLGEGTVEDYKLFNEYRVNVKNLAAVNKYIKDTKSIIKTSSYYVENLTQSVDMGLVLYNLNEGIETVDIDGNVQEFARLGVTMESSNDKNSLDKRVMAKIKEEREKNNNKILSQEEILKIVEDVKNMPVIIEDNNKDDVQGITKLFNNIKNWFLRILKK